ncbi:hypothetical protein BC936DRAFT_143443 [Jimgerdemannia flammicorona]|uniref:Uncharacterized protein n=1 Tax=Jimgerdemannia flammicorona TaxID=994334 RepID=A0A433DDX7_9FUNG|nr:hypothetical protein BC936DRAFT_143443 [Jimgerdemannia flammicorona]
MDPSILRTQESTLPSVSLRPSSAGPHRAAKVAGLSHDQAYPEVGKDCSCQIHYFACNPIIVTLFHSILSGVSPPERRALASKRSRAPLPQQNWHGCYNAYIWYRPVEAGFRKSSATTGWTTRLWE